MKNRAVWLAISALAIATILMVFFVMPRLSTTDQPVGEAINNAGQEIKQAVNGTGDAARQLVDPTPETAPEKTPATTAKGDLAPAPKTASASAEQKPLIVPTFDVLRVEPDGTAVIAGRAEPQARLDVNDQAVTVTTTDVDTSGEFVAIIETPLAPGDHQLVLKATAKDGRTVISEEIATVSVPENKAGELLAMVTKPGEASRLIALPNINQKTKTERVALAGNEPAAASQAPASKASSTTTPSTTTSAAAATPDASAPPMGQMSGAQVATAPVPQAPSDGAVEKPALQVSAVEIEGDRIFVAGIAKPGARLKGYADSAVIGETLAGADGHFVIDGTVPLTIGDHRIAVDQIGSNGQVIVRVEVPFNRPAGDQVAAVASPLAGNTGLAQIDGGAFDRLRNEVSRGFDLLQKLYANGATPSDEQVAAARSSTAIALRSLTEYRLPAGADATTRMIADNTVREAVSALAALDALPRDVASVGEQLGSIGQMIARVVGPVLPNGTVSALPPAAAEAQVQAGARTIAQAPLTQSEAASVIIRRGDTLWQISRRIYGGQGVRYTTIYLANQDQIANPDLIQPGQIFGVPKEALPDPEAEKIHRQRLKKG